MENKKFKFILFILVLVLLLGIGWYFYDSRQEKSYEFAGNVQKIEENILFVKGQTMRNNVFSPGLKEVEVEITPDTSITRVTFRIPTSEELVTTGGVFKPSELPKEQTVGSLETLTSDIEETVVSIQIVSKRNIFGKTQFKASEIIYTVPLSQ